MTASLPPTALTTATRRSATATATVVAAAFVFGCLLSFAAFPDAWAAMVRVWSSSETFTHGYIVLPCTAWMLWRRREDWQVLPRQPWRPAFLALAGCGFVWLVGHLGGVASIEQIAAVGVIPAMILLWAGPVITRTIALPLLFLFFAVPIGEFLTPVMMNYTADATIMAVRWSGVPVFREGLHFSLPTGRWSVVEACSGLRYLIASVALGVVYAWLQFRTWRYRLVIIGLAVIVPIVANWIRAYGIVMLGHLSDMKIATGVDHLIYGWLFFGLVMAIFFWLGSLWHEPEPDAKPHSPRGLPADGLRDGAGADTGTGTGTKQAMIIRAAAAIVLILVWRPVAGILLDRSAAVDVAGPIQTIAGSERAAPADGFTPHFEGAVDSVHAVRTIDGRAVETFVFQYARQHETAEMIQHDNFVVRVDDPASRIVSRGTRSGAQGSIATWHIRRADGQMLLVWQWYAIGGWQTASPYRAKAATAWSLLTARGDQSLTVVLVTPLSADDGATPGEQSAAAGQRLESVAAPLQDVIRKVLDPA